MNTFFAYVTVIPGKTVICKINGKKQEFPATQLNIRKKCPDKKDIYMGKIVKNDIMKLRPLDNTTEYNFCETETTYLATDLYSKDPLAHITKINCPEKVKMPKNMRGTFAYCENLVDIKDIEHFDMSEVECLDSIFKECVSLKKADLGKWNLCNVNSMACMFYHCINLKKVIINDSATIKTLDASGLFVYCRKLTQVKIPKFSTNTNIKDSFVDCPKEIIPSWYKN